MPRRTGPRRNTRNSSRDPRMRKSVRTGLLILLSIAILIGVVAWVGFDETLQGLERAGVTAFVALGLIQLLIMILQTTAWGC